MMRSTNLLIYLLTLAFVSVTLYVNFVDYYNQILSSVSLDFISCPYR